MTGSVGRRRYEPRLWHHGYYPLRQLRAAIEQTLAVHGLARAGEQVLDLGCGDRPYAPLFAGCRYVGCDIDGDAEVRLTPGAPVPLPDGCADGIVSFQVLEHVWELDWYLGECRRLLKPGGWLLLSTHGVWLYHPHPTDYRRWTRAGLERELSSHGFEAADVRPVVGPLAWTTYFRLLGIREAVRRLPVLGPAVLAPVATFMNLRMMLEDRITPAAVRADNASIYVTVSRRTAGALGGAAP
jgi:SAM-dependent methyltransferase